MRKERDFRDLSDWGLAMIGAGSFLVASYLAMVVANVLPDLIGSTNRNRLTLAGMAAFVFLAGIGVKIWFFSCSAARCHSILYKRHFC